MHLGKMGAGHMCSSMVLVKTAFTMWRRFSLGNEFKNYEKLGLKFENIGRIWESRRKTSKIFDLGKLAWTYSSKR